METNFSDMPKKINHHCPLCGERLENNDLDVLKEQDGQLIVYSACLKCGVGMVAKLSVLPHGLVGIGVLTDLNRDELLQLKHGYPISAEDVLDMKIITDKGLLEMKV